jgi:hypothetical protein
MAKFFAFIRRIMVVIPSPWEIFSQVGPDALTADPERGPSAQDEFNVIKSPGNYDWPYLGGNNIPYNQYDYEAKKL